VSVIIALSMMHQSLSSVLKTYGLKKLQIGYSDKNPKYHMPSTHAEVNALNKIIKWTAVPKCINILVVRINVHGTFVNSMPCLHCIKYILRKCKQIKINCIYYSNAQGIIDCIKISDIRHLNDKDLKKMFNVSFGSKCYF